MNLKEWKWSKLYVSKFNLYLICWHDNILSQWHGYGLHHLSLFWEVKVKSTKALKY